MSARHPLDPLTADEIRAAAAIVRSERGVTDRWRFAWIDLKEPSKGVHTPLREAEVVCWNRDDGAAFKGVVSLTDERVRSWDPLRSGEHPPMTPDEFHDCDAALRKHPRVVEALNKRGVTDMDLVLVDTWAYGAELVPDRYRGRRIAWADVWHRDSPEANPYANMLSGMHPIVDLNPMELLELEDVDPGPAPQVMGEYIPELVPGLTLRDDVKEVLTPNVSNGLASPVGYKLEPGAAIPALIDPNSPVVRRARAIEHTLWVTPYSADERWPCGEFPNLSAEDSGLAAWTGRDRSIENADVVLWYVFGINHMTRPEDWPVMPVDTVSFWLKPFGFFDRNPALDVPGHDPAHPGV
jgi:Cu2+-containing amine oxidase